MSSRILISFWKFRIRSDYAAIFLATYEFYYLLENLNMFSDVETLFNFFLIVSDIIAILLFFISLYTKNAWLIVPILITYVYAAVHFLIGVVIKYAVALFPQRFGENYWDRKEYDKVLNSRNLKERFVNECMAEAAVELKEFILMTALVFLYYNVFQDMRREQAKSVTREEKDVESEVSSENQENLKMKEIEEDGVFCSFGPVKITFSFIVVVLGLFEAVYTFANMTKMSKLESSIERYMIAIDLFCLAFLIIGSILSNYWLILPIILTYSVETIRLLIVTLIDFAVATFPNVLGKYYWKNDDYDDAMTFDVLKERLINKCIAEGTVHFIELVLSAALTFCYFRIFIYFRTFKPAAISENVAASGV